MDKLIADKDDELLLVLDENGKSTNALEHRKTIHQKGLFHQEVACVVINYKKQILLQRRSVNKKSYPGCWALFAGHVIAFESPKDAIIIEMREELVSEIKKEEIFLLVPKMKNVRDDNKCFATCFACVSNKKGKDILFQKAEIDEIKWFEIDEFENMIKNEEGTIFKNNDYYNTILISLKNIFSSKNFYRKIDSMVEKIEELDENGEKTGRIITREFAHNYGIYHKKASLFIVNEKNEVLLQKRSLKKIRNSGLWDVSVSGHVRFGETTKSAIIRESREESKYNVKENELVFLTKYKENSKFNEKFIDNAFFDVYITHVKTRNKNVHNLEVEQTKFYNIDELKKMMTDYKILAPKPEAFNALVEYMESIILKNNKHNNKRMKKQ